MTTPILEARAQRAARREHEQAAPVREYFRHPHVIEALAALPVEIADLKAADAEMRAWLVQALADPRYPAPESDDAPAIRHNLGARRGLLTAALATLDQNPGRCARALARIQERGPEDFATGFGPQVIAECDWRDGSSGVAAVWPLLGVAQGVRALPKSIADIEAVIDEAVARSAGAPLTVRRGSGALPERAQDTHAPQTHAASNTAYANA